MKLRTLFLTNNACYKAGVKLKPQGIMVHSTGANNPNLRRYVGPDDGILGINTNGNHWNQYMPDGRSVCVHAFIGKAANNEIYTYQTLPWDMKGWHCGSGNKGSGNDTHIGFEICEDGLTDPDYFRAAYQEAVELCAWLCKEFKLDPMADGVLICHCEGFSRGIASNHGDVMHWFPKHGKSMDSFRADVKAALQSSGNTGSTTSTPAAPAPTFIIPYTVKITAGSLNIRRGPGTNYAINGIIKDKGIYTIAEEAKGPGANKWGRLKSGAGWISLDFTEKR